MWALRPKPLAAEFPSQAPSSQPHPQVCPFSSSRPGPRACRSQGKEAATQSPKAPAHYVHSPGLCAHIAPWKSPLGPCPGRLHTALWPKGFLRVSDFIAPTLGFSHTRHWSWGTHGACSLCPHISTASQGSAHFPHTDLALHLILLPRVGHGLEQGLPPECLTCVASRIRPSVLLLAMGPGPEASCLLRKGKAKAWGLMGKVFYKRHQ